MAQKADFKLKGMEKFMRRLNKEIKELEGRTHTGLINAAIVLRNATYEHVPIDTSNLDKSWFTVSYRESGNKVSPVGAGGFKGKEATDMQSHHNRVIQQATSAAQSIGSDDYPILVFGYSANYAVYVHENIDATFRRPSAHARWLYKAMQANRAEMLEEIRKSASFK